MADINIERKGPPLWLLLLALVVVTIAIWLALRALSRDGVATFHDPPQVSRELRLG